MNRNQGFLLRQSWPIAVIWLITTGCAFGQDQPLFVFSGLHSVELYEESKRHAEDPKRLSPYTVESYGVQIDQPLGMDLLNARNYKVVAFAHVDLETLLTGEARYSYLWASDGATGPRISNFRSPDVYNGVLAVSADIEGVGHLDFVASDTFALGYLAIKDSELQLQHIQDDVVAFLISGTDLSQLRAPEKLNNPGAGFSPLIDCDQHLNQHFELELVVGFTSAAKNLAVRNIEGLIVLSGVITDTAMKNSKLSVDVKISKIGEIYFDESESLVDNLRQLERGEKNLSELLDWRSDNQADIAILVVHNDDPTDCGEVAAVNAGVSEALAVVNWQCLDSQQSFAHEIGHLLGAGHIVDQDRPDYAHGHRAQGDFGLFATLMAEQTYCHRSDCYRAPAWSNPAVSHANAPTGVAGSNDNACEIRRNIPRIAAYGESLVP